MELPIKSLLELDEFVSKLDKEGCVTDRQAAIREAARLLVYLTNDEYYGSVDAFDQNYCSIANACRAFVEH